MTMPEATTLAVAFAGGVALGIIHFTLLYRAARLHGARAPAVRLVALHGLRAAITVAGFLGLVQLGAVPLLVGLCGFLGVRIGAIRLARRNP